MGEDFREGITAVLATFVRNPQFEGQTKGKLGNTEVRPAVEAFVYARMTEYLENLKNQDVAQSIVEKALRALQSARSRAQGEGSCPREEPAGCRAAGGQAFQLHGQKSGRKRNVHR